MDYQQEDVGPLQAEETEWCVFLTRCRDVKSAGPQEIKGQKQEKQGDQLNRAECLR